MKCVTFSNYIPLSKICDCYPDCKDGSDETEELCSYTTCQLMGTESYYKLNKHSNNRFIYLCWSGTHEFSVPFYIFKRRMLKPEIHLIGDGREDCINGMDESFIKQFSITSAFRCAKEGVLVDYVHLGDGTLECRQRFDDELIEMFNHNCMSAFCVCHGFTVLCLGFLDVPINKHTKTLIITSDSGIRPSYICCDSIEMFANLTFLIVLEMHMHVRYLGKCVFKDLHFLTHLDISQNQISSLSSMAFFWIEFLT